MIQATQLKKGMCIKHDNDLYRVVEAQHKTPGNLRGMVQAKIRNLKSGSISDHRFRSVDMVERAILDETEMEFLYQDGDMFHFMNNETFEQIGLSDEVRNGYNQIRVNLTVAGDASPERLRALVEQCRARSAVSDVITGSVPIAIDVTVA